MFLYTDGSETTAANRPHLSSPRNRGQSPKSALTSGIHLDFQNASATFFWVLNRKDYRAFL
ncbi:hypothetical protein [Pseudobacteriovorax antillogorgiicola]|uniref:Uncharacterized protein n=1 Tax=Pseudobacteriovorax antillogorgiicola TaxID=1513793 RepID=A0A1Y6C204_9BACT|nr:hypothetical protein [Pseudobacteriovorax antillogorgiicola]TCS50772.1 hypothetical protein EDD56_112155 [Pseudobacteriovorax antillogorgiicola]SMF41338.1 hypothetical protein SAMN06296036_112154 [Pseudobacteriovorax antillogorgiicola]